MSEMPTFRRDLHPSLLGGLARGVIAGAAGTTALNAATYIDMAVRGRGTSSAPEDVVEKVAEQAGLEIPGEGESRDNRVAGLGPLSGIAVGIAVGAAAGLANALFARKGRRLPWPFAAVLTGAAAMALADVPMKALGVSDPANWKPQDWAADAVPHLGYGLVVAAVLTVPSA